MYTDVNKLVKQQKLQFSRYIILEKRHFLGPVFLTQENLREDGSGEYDNSYDDNLSTTDKENLSESAENIGYDNVNERRNNTLSPKSPHFRYYLYTYPILLSFLSTYFSRNSRSLFIAELVPFAESPYALCSNPAQVTWVESNRGWVVSPTWHLKHDD